MYKFCIAHGKGLALDTRAQAISAFSTASTLKPIVQRFSENLSIMAVGSFSDLRIYYIILYKIIYYI